MSDQTKKTQEEAKRDARKVSNQVSGDAKTAADAIKSDAQKAYSEAQDRARNMADDAKNQARSFVEEKKGEAAGQVHELAESLRESASNFEEHGQASLASVATEFADTIENFSDRMRAKELSDVLHDVEEFARERPVVFVGIAATIGFVMSRFAKASAEARAMRDYQRRYEGHPSGAGGSYAGGSSSNAEFRRRYGGSPTASETGSTEWYDNDRNVQHRPNPSANAQGSVSSTGSPSVSTTGASGAARTSVAGGTKSSS